MAHNRMLPPVLLYSHARNSPPMMITTAWAICSPTVVSTMPCR
jgi:hypothetical protein